ncbi:VOC family protein [Alicyclobacillus cycloheptanicus]|uniref:Catechol 2,3-dioxygenase-like lactoylglutathione lyase family enzyme n=1 Tax=Alicyclobacillus cycloheptanicus TaxID=1457 RepID=A0ABT9XIZ3_9BACL|nr:VOC family protein [Alicyclobacillus cycloheptanicus]MDQ0189753.1 catechol 2,3-dioxygenase-like lactoylglutathione lyase family enzyme [Alicyclobacillus cycloheptanicus]WDM01958.1 VOC family protein [Alicyclobacillus cycloheptanicus]
MMRVSFVSIPVTDQDRALQFYTEKLGFDVVTDQAFGNGMRWIQLKPPGAETDVVLFTPPGQENRIGGYQNIAFTCEDVVGTCHTLKARGVVFVKEPERANWGGMEAIFQDPDGNTFVLANPRE